MPGKLFGMVSTNSLSMVKTETLSIRRQVFWRTTCKSQASSVAELVPHFALDILTSTAVSSGTSKRWFPVGLAPYSSICSCLKRYNHWMTLPFFRWSIQIVSLCRFAVMEQEMELAPQPFACLDAKEVSLLHFHVPRLLTLNARELRIFETSPHPLSDHWELDRKFPSCWGGIKVHTEAALGTAHFLRTSWLSRVCGEGGAGRWLRLWLPVRRS